MITFPDYEGLYRIHDNGQVYSVRKDRFLTQQRTSDLYPYKNVFLVPHKGEGRWFKVHRLVALHFIGGPTLEKGEINHIDGDKENNHFSNLEWVSHSENIQKSFDNGREPYTGPRKRPGALTRRKMAKKKFKPILAQGPKDLDFESIQEAANHFGVHRKTIQTKLATGKRFKGYAFTYK